VAQFTQLDVRRPEIKKALAKSGVKRYFSIKLKVSFSAKGTLEVAMKGSYVGVLQVDVDRIPDEGLAIRADAPIDGFPALRETSSEEDVRFLSPVHIDVNMRWVSRFVEASGSLGTSVRLICSRCLKKFTQTVSVPFEATYTDEAPGLEGPRGEAEVELTSEVINLFPFHGRNIDLTEAVQEQVLLGLPVRPLCREDCNGLCPHCGADLNKSACVCDEKPIDPRFAVLKNLQLDKK
jgi:uncharacterized protein